MSLFSQLFVALFRFAIAFFAFAGTYEGWMGIIPNNLVYFTTQTNIVIGLVMVWAGFATLLRGIQPPAWLKGCLTLYISVTGLVAWLILAPPDPATTTRLFGMMTSTMVHIIVPIGAVIDFLLFDRHRRMKWHYSLTWLIYFPVYLAFVCTRAAIWPHSGPGADGDPYPYPFIDLTVIEWQDLAVNIAIYLTAFLALGLIIVGIDRILPARALIHSGRSSQTK